MDTFSSQFKKEAYKIRLSAPERAAMQSALEKTMQETRLVKSPIKIVPSPLFFVPQRFASALAFVLVIALAGSGTAYAAEGALPGDFLYPIKINVNESIRTTLARTPEAKAEWHARAVERRLEEAEVLAARGTLSESARAEIESNLDEHAAEVEVSITTIEENDPIAAADISSRFESSVEAHSALLARLGEEGEREETRRVSRTFAAALKERARRVAPEKRGPALAVSRKESGAVEIRMTMQATDMNFSATVEPDSDAEVALRLSENASTTLDKAEETLKALEGRVSATSSQRTKVQILRLRNLLEKLRAINGGDEEREQIHKAFKDATTIKTFLEAQEKFEEHKILPAPENDKKDEERDHSPDALETMQEISLPL